MPFDTAPLWLLAAAPSDASAWLALAVIPAVWVWSMRGGRGESSNASQVRGGWPAALALVAATVSSVSILGGSGLVYRDGASAALWLAVVWFGTGLALALLARWGGSDAWAPTLAEAVTRRFERRAALRWLVALGGIACAGPLAFLQILFCGELFERVHPGWFAVGAVGAGLIGVLGAVTGESRAALRRAAWGAVLLAGLAVLAWRAWSAAGIAGVLAAAEAPDLAASTPLVPATYAGFAGLAFLVVAAGVLQPAVWHWASVLPAEDRALATRRYAWLTVGVLMPAIPLVGLAGRAIFPLRFGDAWQMLPHPAVTEAADGFDRLILAWIPGGGLMAFAAVAVLLAACLASLETQLRAAGSIVAHDLYRPLFRRAVSESEESRVAKSASLALGLAALAVALVGRGDPARSLAGMAADLAGISALVLVQLLPAAIDAFFVRKARAGVLAAGIVVGWLAVAPASQWAAIVAGRVPLVEYLVARWESWRGGIPIGLAALGLNLLVAVVFSMLGEDASKPKPDQAS